MNQRELKFRAWGTVSKSMIEWDDLRPNLSLAFEHAKRGAIILMQFTGLKDKHGCEIYEGDIVSHYTTDKGKKTQLRLIEWRKGGRGAGRVGFNIAPSSTHEVIGNRYENPELIPEKVETP